MAKKSARKTAKRHHTESAFEKLIVGHPRTVLWFIFLLFSVVTGYMIKTNGGTNSSFVWIPIAMIFIGAAGLSSNITATFSKKRKK